GHRTAQLAGVRRLAGLVDHAGAGDAGHALLVGRRRLERAGVAARVRPGVLEGALRGVAAVRVQDGAPHADRVAVVGRVLGERDAVVADAVGARVDRRARRARVARGGEQRPALDHRLAQDLLLG